MSAEFLAGVAGTLLSLILSYVPGLNAKWEGLDGDVKRLVMLGLLVLAAAGSYGLACAGLAGDLGIGVTCDQAGLITLAKALAAAAILNQAVYKLSPRVHG